MGLGVFRSGMGLVVFTIILSGAHRTAGRHCPDLETASLAKEQAPKGCDAPDGASWLNSIYFATQTITTTGYGTAINAGLPEVQAIASVGSVVGATGFAVFTAAVIAAFLVPKPEREKRRREREARRAEKKAKKDREKALKAANERLAADLARLVADAGTREARAQRDAREAELLRAEVRRAQEEVRRVEAERDMERARAKASDPAERK